jgi:two-component system cell cycle sensor histidine kinase/response regulator CckA
VMGIVRSHKGALQVRSRPGSGTTFKVLLPAVAAAEGASSPIRSPDLAGTGTILVIDDEEMVRHAARHMLERYGYRVATATDGAEAIRIFRQRPEEYTAVLLDLTMPVMSGEETLQQLQGIAPDVRVLLSSGYSETEALRHFAGKGLAGFIQKPYTAVGLAKKVKEVIQA